MTTQRFRIWIELSYSVVNMFFSAFIKAALKIFKAGIIDVEHGYEEALKHSNEITSAYGGNKLF